MNDKIYCKKCKRCGNDFETAEPRKRLCDACKNYNKQKYYETYRSVKLQEPMSNRPSLSLDEIVHAVCEYNRTHEKALSYGQYVHKFGL